MTTTTTTEQPDHHNPYSPPQPDKNPQQQQRRQKQVILDSINKLDTVAVAILKFKGSFDELQGLFDYIQNGIELLSSSYQQQEERELEEDKPELEILCKTMNGKGVRRYVLCNENNVDKLKEEFPQALKHASKPGKLVLESLGRFFSLGKPAFEKNVHLVSLRRASVLILELFLLAVGSGDVDVVEKGVKKAAERVVLEWRKRVFAEGGWGCALEIDARGLLVFVGCFGIPRLLSNDDIWNLVKLTNLERIGNQLRLCKPLVQRVSDVIKQIIDHGVKIEAVNVVRHFGIEDKYSPEKILTLFLADTDQVLKKRTKANTSPHLLKEANEKHLAALTSATEFLNDLKLDPEKFLPGCQDMIKKVEKDVAALKEKLDNAPKRKADANYLNNTNNNEAKRLRYLTKDSPTTSSQHVGLQELRAVGHMDGENSYNSLMPVNSPDGGYSGRMNRFAMYESLQRTHSPFEGNSSYRNDQISVRVPDSELSGCVSKYLTASSPPYGSELRSLPREVIGTTRDARLAPLSISGAPSRNSSDSAYGFRETINDNGAPSAHGADTYGLTRQERPIRASVTGLFGPSPVLEGFVGLPDSPTGGVIYPSDLYRFVDTVVEPKYVRRSQDTGLVRLSYRY